MQRDVFEEMDFRINHCWIEGEFDDIEVICFIDLNGHEPEEKKYTRSDCCHCGAVFSIRKLRVRHKEYEVCSSCGKTPMGVQWTRPKFPVHVRWE